MTLRLFGSSFLWAWIWLLSLAHKVFAEYVGGNLTNGVELMSVLSWEPKATFPGGGRHHPITFANATHGFLLTGSGTVSSYMSDFWIYDAAADSWTDLSNTAAAFPGVARTYGYGVSSTTNCSNSKAYLGFGASALGERLTDWWEFDMKSLGWTRLAEFPGIGRRHPAMNYVEGSVNEIHVGLGDGIDGNLKDWWAYDVASNSWRQLPDLPGIPRHHPFYFHIGSNSYAGLGHSSTGIERDWYHWDSVNEMWISEIEFASFPLDSADGNAVTTEARVAGTQFSASGSCNDDALVYGFVLSGDGDDHGTIETGEFHFFDPYSTTGGAWHPLPPHPGFSRWAPGSFVLQGSTHVYFLGGYDRTQQMLFDDVWMMDLEPLFEFMANSTSTSNDESDIGSAPDSATSSSADHLDTGSGSIGSAENGTFDDGSGTAAPASINFASIAATKLRSLPGVATSQLLMALLMLGS